MVHAGGCSRTSTHRSRAAMDVKGEAIGVDNAMFTLWRQGLPSTQLISVSCLHVSMVSFIRLSYQTV